MDIKKVRAKGELILLFFIVMVGIISLLVVFYPIFKAAIVNPFTDALFIFLIFLICWFTFVTVKTMKDNPPPKNENKDKGAVK
jgi:amino acid permease